MALWTFYPLWFNMMWFYDAISYLNGWYSCNSLNASNSCWQLTPYLVCIDDCLTVLRVYFLLPSCILGCLCTFLWPFILRPIPGISSLFSLWLCLDTKSAVNSWGPGLCRILISIYGCAERFFVVFVTGLLHPTWKLPPMAYLCSGENLSRLC